MGAGVLFSLCSGDGGGHGQRDRRCNSADSIVRPARGVLWGDFRNMAKRYLEHHETDGNILCDRFGGDDAGGVSLLLDGAQPERVSQLFCYLYRSICPDLADTVYACQA